MDERSLNSWFALLSAFVKNNYANRALEFFINMLQNGFTLDSGCFSIVLDGCSECNNLKFGLQIRGLIVKLGHVQNGSLKSARVVFDKIPDKTIALFNAILVGYLNSKIRDDEDEEDPIIFFRNLRFNGVRVFMLTL